nr:RNA-directed DNA polymerase, eukaryota [Tanacetum cinerariifolium]
YFNQRLIIQHYNAFEYVFKEDEDVLNDDGDESEGHFIIFGDMNEVHDEIKWYGTLFSKAEAQTITSFIDDTGFIDLPLGGRSYT